MTLWYRALVMMAILVGAPVLAQPVIAEHQVRQLLLDLDTAIERRDAIAVGRLFDDQALIRITVSPDGVKQSMQMSKAQYVSTLQQGWALASDYSYSRSNEQIRMEGERAVVTSRTTEVLTLQGQQTFNSVSEGTVILTLVNGTPRIVSIEAVVAF